MFWDNPLQRRLLQAGWRHAFRPAISGNGCRPVNHLALLLRAQERAWRLSQYRERLGAPVALRFPKATSLVEHLVAVILAGGTYVCLDPHASTEDSLRGLSDIGTKLLVHGRHHGFPTDLADVPDMLCLQAGFAWSARRWRQVSQQTKAPTACALVRTSGTSGKSCGVIQDAAAILHHADWTIASQKIDAHSRLSWVAAPGVAAAHSHLFASLLSGACLCPFEPAHAGLNAMTQWLRAERITHLHLTPSLLRAWLESLPDTSEFPDLLCVKLGGEPARSADARLLRRRLGARPRLLNGLGMSEASGNLTLCEITAHDLEADGLLPVGRPVVGRLVTVETEPGRLAAPGETGEIVVRDEWVSPGYRPAGARNAIRATDQPGIRELRTGDAGRWNNKGQLVHLGRLDRRIRVRGITVDLAEVEAWIAASDCVRQVAAIAEETGAGFRVALLLRDSREATRNEVKESLKTLRGVQPARVAFVTDIPLKPDGKRDDALLLKNWPAEETAVRWTGCEIYVRAAWAKVLGHSDFGPKDRFTHAGGDSLSAMNLALELGRLAQREIAMTDLVRFPTVAAQAQALEQLALGTLAGHPPSDRFQTEWVRIQTTDTGRTAWIHPGGYSSESDLWLAGVLMSEMPPDLSLMVAKTSIANPLTPPPKTWAEVIDPMLLKTEGSRPLLVGVCLGALVISKLAERLKVSGGPEAEVILLDPWTPGTGEQTGAREHPEAVLSYYDLLKRQTYPDAVGPAHVILAGDDPEFEQRKQFWSGRLRSAACLHVVTGDHLSFLRAHRNETARVLASVVN